MVTTSFPAVWRRKQVAALHPLDLTELLMNNSESQIGKRNARSTSCSFNQGREDMNSTHSSTLTPSEFQDTERQNDGIGKRICAVLVFVRQRIGLRWLVGFLALFAVIVAVAWRGLDMGQAPVPRQMPAPDIESAAPLLADASPPDESSSDTSSSDTSPSDASMSEASQPTNDSATTVAKSSSKKSSNTRRKARYIRKGKSKVTPAGDHLSVPYMKKKLY